MLKRNITYTDFNGDTSTETFYFNFSKAELIEMDVEVEGGLKGYLERIVEAENKKEIVAAIKKIVLASYGQKSPDGKRFVKSEDLRREFEQSAAYEVLFMELATDDEAAVIFIKGIMPPDLVAAVAQEQAKVTEIKPS